MTLLPPIQSGTKRVAVIGDVHGVIDEFEELLRRLEFESIDAVYHLGDLVDRGPDSGAVVQKCRESGFRGVLGNHESTILTLYKNVKDGKRQASPDKTRTISQLSAADITYLESLPLLHVLEDLKTVLIHAGLEPRFPVWKSTLPIHHYFGAQTHNVCHVQLVHPDHPGKTRWWGWDPKNELTEEQNRAEGWRRWYEFYEEPYLAVYGHSVFFDTPFQHGNTYGIDTGGVFGGSLTALILPDMKVVQVKAKRAYCERRLTSKTPYNTDP